MKPRRRVDARQQPGKAEARELVALPRRGQVGEDQHEIDLVVGDLGMMATRRRDAAARRKLTIPAAFLEIGAGPLGNVAAGLATIGRESWREGRGQNVKIPGCAAS